MLSSMEHSSIKQQAGRRDRQGASKGERKEIKRDGPRQTESRKEGDRGGDSESIWNMFTVISLGPDVIVALHLVDQNFAVSSVLFSSLLRHSFFPTVA